MNICGLQKLSLLDYPGKTAATVFTGGCNLRCPFCHNALLVTEKQFNPVISNKDFFSFLNKRKGLLDGICITGGEPLLQNDLKDFIIKIKKMNFCVKLDTNGTFPNKLKELINDNLLDYVAMDVKNSIKKYPSTVGINDFDTKNIIESINIIKSSNITYEFRTTLVKEFHSLQDIENIGKLISDADNYYLQSFVDSGNLIGGNLHSVSKDDTIKFKNVVTKYVKHCDVRGI